MLRENKQLLGDVTMQALYRVFCSSMNKLNGIDLNDSPQTKIT